MRDRPRTSDNALLELDGAIFQASLAVAEWAKPTIENLPEGDKQTKLKWTYVLFESLYFFMHLTNRSAYGRLIEDRARRLQEKLGPLCVHLTVETLFSDWPEDKKEAIRREFCENLNKADFEYSGGRGIVPQEPPLQEPALIPTFVRNLAEIVAPPDSALFLVSARIFVVEVFAAMHLDDFVVAAGREL